MKESKDYYYNAKKLALKEYSKSVSNGETGYLPSLDNLITRTEIMSEINLGILEIPLKKIAGTYSHLRSLSFAKNFMPILENNTEFQLKWTHLCEAHLSEGIRNPIKVYEFLNRFYVIEGNKRVSVLKFFKAYSIYAEVIRLIPKKDDDDPNIKKYYKFLKFNKITGIFTIWFSKDKNFDILLNYLENYNPHISKLDNKYKYFEIYIYGPFRKIYLKNGGQNFPITTGDAFIEYAKIYGIPEKIDEEALKSTINEFFIELKSITNGKHLHIQMEPAKNVQKNVLSAITTFVKPKKQLKAAFAYARTIKSSGWTYAHELGRLHVEDVLKDQVSTSYIENVPEDEKAYDVFKKLAEDGNDIIFTTSPIFLNATLKCAIEYPQIKFFNCSEANAYTHVSNYYGRTYEPRFLTGIIAGSVTKNNIIGYVGTTPNSEVISSINAFALGAKMVNPYAKVLVAWTNEWNSRVKFSNAGSKLIKENADVICNRTLDVPHPVSKDFGVYSMLCTINKEKGSPEKYLATPIWQWGIFYEKIIKTILNGTFNTIIDMYGNSSKLINFWWGMESGVVDIFYSKELVPIGTQKLVKIMKNMIINKYYHPFTGPIYDQEGSIRIQKDEVASHKQILKMNWFVDNVKIID